MADFNEIAIFPIPKVVAFPAMVMPLHIFEPRYRKMAEDSESQGFDVGIALPKKTISEPDLVKDSLNSNHASYEAHSILSAGALKILKKLEDGRFLVRIEFRYRCQITEIVQSIPYYRAKVEIIEDLEPAFALAKSMVVEILELAGHILNKPIHIDDANLGPQNVMRTLQTIFNWTLSWLPVDPELAQEMLEMDSIEVRTLELLKHMQAHAPQSSSVPARGLPKRRKDGKIIYVDFASGIEPSESN